MPSTSTALLLDEPIDKRTVRRLPKKACTRTQTASSKPSATSARGRLEVKMSGQHLVSVTPKPGEVACGPAPFVAGEVVWTEPP